MGAIGTDTIETTNPAGRYCMYLMGGFPMATADEVYESAGLALTAAAERRTDPSRPVQIVVIASAKFTRATFNDALVVAGGLYMRRGYDVKIKILHDFDTPPTGAAKLLAGADLLHIPGGSPEFAMEMWAGFIDDIIAAIRRGAVVFGHSFGTGIWWQNILSDLQSYPLPEGAAWEYEMFKTSDRYPGIVLFEGDITIHANDLAGNWTNNPDKYGEGVTRRDVFVEALRASRRRGLAIDGGTTLGIRGYVATVYGVGRVTLHLWIDDELVERDFTAGESFDLRFLAS